MWLSDIRVIPCEITHSKNESLSIVFILSTLSVHLMRLIFRIMNSHRMYILSTKYENIWKWFIFWVCDFTWNDPLDIRVLIQLLHTLFYKISLQQGNICYLLIYYNIHYNDTIYNDLKHFYSIQLLSNLKDESQ